MQLADPAPGEVLVRLVSAGMCHTDVVPRTLEMLLPIITGHEGSGVVEAVGEGVTGIAVATRGAVVRLVRLVSGLRPGDAPTAETFFARNLTDATSPGAARSPTPRVRPWRSVFGQSSFATHCIATARNAVVVDATLRWRSSARWAAAS